MVTKNTPETHSLAGKTLRGCHSYVVVVAKYAWLLLIEASGMISYKVRGNFDSPSAMESSS